jgi:hypothetical protein
LRAVVGDTKSGLATAITNPTNGLGVSNTDGGRAAMAEFIGFEPLVCADDAEAIDQAKRLVNGSDIELWTGARLVARLEAKTKK